MTNRCAGFYVFTRRARVRPEPRLYSVNLKATGAPEVLKSALRRAVFVAGFFYDSAPRYGLVDPESRFAFQLERPRKSRKRRVTPRDALINAVHRLQR